MNNAGVLAKIKIGEPVQRSYSSCQVNLTPTHHVVRWYKAKILIKRSNPGKIDLVIHGERGSPLAYYSLGMLRDLEYVE